MTEIVIENAGEAMKALLRRDLRPAMKRATKMRPQCFGN